MIKYRQHNRTLMQSRFKEIKAMRSPDELECFDCKKSLKGLKKLYNLNNREWKCEECYFK